MIKIALAEQVLQILNKTKTQTLEFTLMGPQHPPYEIHSNLQTELTDAQIKDIQKKCLRLGFDLNASRKFGSVNQWVLKQVDKRAVGRDKAASFNMTEGIPFNVILEYVNTKINMYDVMSTLIDSIASGDVKVTFKVVNVLQPDPKEINQVQIDRLKSLGYTCTIMEQNNDTFCTVYGW